MRLVHTPVTRMGVDVGARKLSWSIFEDGELVHVGHHESTATGNRAHEVAGPIKIINPYLKHVDELWIEEPLAGRSVRASLLLAQCAGAFLGHVGLNYPQLHPQLVSNTAWKKAIIGNGNADKEKIATWLEQQHEDWFTAHCLFHRPKAGLTINQDIVDAVCIGLYAEEISKRSSSFAQGATV